MQSCAGVMEIDREWAEACEVQRGFMPHLLPGIEILSYSARCRQLLELGGYCYDFVPLPDNRVAVTVGDASGKGLAAALMISNVQSALRTAALLKGEDGTAVLELVNRQVHASALSDRYATLFYGVFDGSTRTLHYVNAGHNPPVVLRSSGESLQVFRLEAGGPVVGLFRHGYECGSFSHQPGDLLVLFTDGVSESMNARLEEWGEGRMMDLARECYGLPASEVLRRILSAAQAFAAGAPQHDDMTLVVIRVF